MPTPNRGYIYPATSSPATVPADLQAPLEQIDADMQDLADRVTAREHLTITHAGDGSWAVTDGLAEPVPVNALGDGTYSIGA